MAEATTTDQATTPQPDQGAVAASPPKSQAKDKGITKVDAVAKALRKLGKDATRDQIRTFVKEQFDIEITPDHVSNCKSELRKRKAAQKAAAKKTATPQPVALPAAQATETAPSQAHVPVVGNGKASARISLSDLQTVKELTGRVGVQQLRTLIDLLA